MNIHPIDDNEVISKRYDEERRIYGGGSILVKRALDRVERLNKNYLGFCHGQTGTGKTYAMLAFAQACNPDFSIEQVVFRPREFFSLLTSQEFRQTKGVKVMLWDEMGVGMPAKEWFSFQNKAISYILQTFRVQNIIFLATAPSESFIDASVRPLFHQFFETVRIDKTAQAVIVKPFDIVKYRGESKPWTVYPRFKHYGILSTITSAAFGLPSVKLIHAYEKLHREYKENLQVELGMEVDAFEERRAFARLKAEDIIPLVLKDSKAYLRKQYGGRIAIDETRIILRFGIGRQTAMVVKRAVERELPICARSKS